MNALEEATQIVEDYLDLVEQCTDIRILILGSDSPRICLCRECSRELDDSCVWLFDMKYPEE